MAVESRGDLASRHGSIGPHRRGALLILSLRQSYLHQNRIQANPQEPHSASADFDLVRLVAEGEVDREHWSLSLQFLFLDEIPPDLIVHNPMGIVITYLQGDRAVVTGER